MANNTILATYSPEDINIVLANDNFSFVVSGFTDGTFITIARVIPASALYTGADGSNARTLRDVRNLDITFTLHQASEANDILSQLLQLDMEARNSDNLFSFTMRDNTGRTMVSSPTCFIGTTPSIDFATDISNREWVLHSVGSQVYVGGNGKFTTGGWAAIGDLGLTPDAQWTPPSQNP